MKNITFVFIMIFSTSLAAQTWEQLNDTPFQKEGFITCTYNGKGYFVEGANITDPSNEVWEYDPSSDVWTQLDSDILPESEESAGVGIDNLIYIYTGSWSPGPVEGFYVYDIETQTATQLSYFNNMRRGTLVVYEDKIFAGGDIFNNWMMYDIPTDTWVERTPIPSDVFSLHLGYTFVIGDYIYLGGGHNPDWLKYDIANDTWSTFNSEAGARHGGNGYMYNGKGYIIGGDADGHMPVTDLSNYFLEYDPIADTWEALPTIPGLERFQSGSFFIDDALYYFGGSDISPSVNGDRPPQMYKYDFMGITSTHDLASEFENLKLNPNPARDVLNIDNSLDLSLGDNTYNIYDMIGNKIHDGKISNNQIRLTALPAGSYVLTIKVGDKLYRSTFVKI